MIAGFVAVGLFLLAQTIAAIAALMKAVAWASSMDTKMNFMLEISKGFMGAKDKFSTKEEVATALVVVEKNTALAVSVVQREAAVVQASIEKELKAMWLKIDSLNKV